MDISEITSAIEGGLQFVEKLAPYAADMGVPFAGIVGKAAGAVGEVIENVQTQVADGKLVAASTDVEYINSMADRLFAANTALNDYIQGS